MQKNIKIEEKGIAWENDIGQKFKRYFHLIHKIGLKIQQNYNG